MAYGPLCQCAFMSYGPRIQQKAPPVKGDKHIWDKQPPFEPPPGCEAPPPGAFMLMSFDMHEAKADPSTAMRSLPLDDKYIIFGSSQTHDGQVHDGHKTVSEQHACLFFLKGKWHLKAVNGGTFMESMTLHPWLRDAEGAQPKRYTSQNGRKTESIHPIDPKKRLSREMCVFRLGESERRFWVSGPLPAKEGEVEETTAETSRGGGGGGGERRKRSRDRGEKAGRREREKARSRTRSRSRSHRRRK